MRKEKALGDNKWWEDLSAKSKAQMMGQVGDKEQIRM